MKKRVALLLLLLVLGVGFGVVISPEFPVDENGWSPPLATYDGPIEEDIAEGYIATHYHVERTGFYDGKPWLGVCNQPYAATTVIEFKRIVELDPIIAKEFEGFDWDKARILEVPKDIKRHVTYRRDNQVFWTRKQIQISKGEFLLTDGTRTYRSFCCNQMSEVAREPAAPEDPPEALLQPNERHFIHAREPFLFPPFTPGDPPFGPGPPACEMEIDDDNVPTCVCQEDDPRPECDGVPPGQPPVVPPMFPPMDPPMDPPNPVPEPSTVILMMTGLAILAWTIRKRKRED